jgi:hypothetical protein
MLRDLSELPDTPTWTTDLVAGVTGYSRWTIYDTVRDGGGLDLGDGTILRPIRCGRALRWPAAPIRRALGLDESSTSTAPVSPAGERRTAPEFDSRGGIGATS